MENNIKYGTKEIFRDTEPTEDGIGNEVWKSRLVCLCGNKMQGTYENRSDVPNDFECEKCGNITFDTRFARNKRYVAPTLLNDYSDMVKKMGGVPEKYPKSLKRVHDVAMLNYRKWKSKLTKEDFLIATKRYSELQYLSNDKKYSFIIPETIGDLVREGSSLNHCIASYDNRVIEGSSQIVFMRYSKEIEKPLVSIEVKNGRVNQARGYSNRDVTLDEFKAILEWSKKNDIIY